ncbi:MAG: hypothetical protein U5K76_01660 [Woeseiaceae bacterium]|nr:hypothetical protein [Woeseiaceae bacterium]
MPRSNWAAGKPGLSVYAEYEDSESFYRGREPEQQVLQASFNADLGSGFSMEFGGMYYASDGYNQTPGWNRLTQNLIDNGTYITGRDTFVSDLGGTGYLTRSDFDAAVGTFFGASQITQYLEFFFGLPAGGERFRISGRRRRYDAIVAAQRCAVTARSLGIGRCTRSTATWRRNSTTSRR